MEDRADGLEEGIDALGAEKAAMEDRAMLLAREQNSGDDMTIAAKPSARGLQIISFLYRQIEAVPSTSDAPMKNICRCLDPEFVKDAASTTLSSDVEEQNKRHMARKELVLRESS